RTWHVPGALDLDLMRAEAQCFVGQHDFASFAANRGQPEHDTVRTIQQVQLRRSGPCVVVEFTGDGFLYKMVRLMVGALARCARGQAAPGEVRQRLESPAQTPATARFVAPAAGLYLVRVRY
ncbi:MAG: tRNA pseudouridine(38-40) synthase TruA, partial [Chthoniobacterales bacterium]|nr:tRNA pseudouridine(38-40) synthase TruA [Chthoniobacterales bacterium]